jgi:hypothetical protein
VVASEAADAKRLAVARFEEERLVTAACDEGLC